MSKNRSDDLPSHWPSGIRFLDRLATDGPQVDRDLRTRVASAWQGKPRGARRRDVRIKKIEDWSHPAYGQYGLFAARKFARSEWVIEYVGELLPDSSPQIATSDYTLRFREDHSIDASRAGNEARFVNDYRGVAEKPNVGFSEADSGNGITGGGDMVLGFRVLHHGLKKGEEILASYGKGFWKARGLI